MAPDTVTVVLVLPAAAVWWVARPAPFEVIHTLAPPGALPQAGLTAGAGHAPSGHEAETVPP